MCVFVEGWGWGWGGEVKLYRCFALQNEEVLSIMTVLQKQAVHTGPTH